jgi:hypothetical protein
MLPTTSVARSRGGAVRALRAVLALLASSSASASILSVPPSDKAAAYSAMSFVAASECRSIRFAVANLAALGVGEGEVSRVAYLVYKRETWHELASSSAPADGWAAVHQCSERACAWEGDRLYHAAAVYLKPSRARIAHATRSVGLLGVRPHARVHVQRNIRRAREPVPRFRSSSGVSRAHAPAPSLTFRPRPRAASAPAVDGAGVKYTEPIEASISCTPAPAPPTDTASTFIPGLLAGSARLPSTAMTWEDKCTTLNFQMPHPDSLSALGTSVRNVRKVTYYIKLSTWRDWRHVASGYNADNAWAVDVHCQDPACGLQGLSLEHKCTLRFYEEGARPRACERRLSCPPRARARCVARVRCPRKRARVGAGAGAGRRAPLA